MKNDVQRRRFRIGGDYAASGSSTTFVTLGGLPPWPPAAARQTITWTQQAAPSTLVFPVSGAVERHGRRSGGLAGTFTPLSSGSEFTASVGISPFDSARAIVPGLIPEFAEVVMAGLRAISRSPYLRALGAGHLEIDPTWWHQIDSSASGFRELAAKLAGVLSLPADASAEDVWARWRAQNEAVELASLLSFVNANRGDKRFEGLGAPASPAELAALEEALGFQVPVLLCETLLSVNGGTFLNDDGFNVGATIRFALLSAGEIRSAYTRLAIEQTKRARPAFTLPDGTSVPWPFIPVARELDSSSLLVLEVLPIPYANRVQLAKPGLHWRDWPVLYSGYWDLMQAFTKSTRSAT